MLAILAIIFIILYIAHYLFFAIKDTQFYCGNPEFSNFIHSKCSILKERYWPYPFFCNAHLMTRFCTIFRGKLPKISFSREIIPTPDNGQISIDWYAPGYTTFTAQSILDDKRPIALFLPGIAGTSAAEYLRTLVPLAEGIGYRPVVLNYRGLTSTPLLNSRLYCALCFNDLETTLKHIKKVNPNCKIITTALSMGGTMLCNYLTTRGSSSLIDAAFMGSIIWDTPAGNAGLERGFWNRDINKMMARMLVKIVQRHRVWYENDPMYNLKEIEASKSLKEFDESFTKKMFGFKSAEEYYRACTHTDKVHLIKVPTLCLQAADDMMAQEKTLPKTQVASSNYVAMLVTARGGHLGFMDAAKSEGQTTYYLERLFVQYMKALYDLPGNPRDLISS